MEKKIDFVPENATQTENEARGEEKKVDSSAPLERLAEELLDKYEAAFLELAK